MSTNDNGLSIQLNDTNWHSFKYFIRSVLRGKDLLHCIEKKEDKPATDTQKAQTLSLLVRSVTQSQIVHFGEAEDPAIAWANLTRVHQRDHSSEVVNLIQTITSKAQSDEQPVLDYAAPFSQALRDLHRLCEKKSVSDLIELLVVQLS